MKVMKFGGTSVGSVESILNVKKIVESEQESVIVVVSALGGITDKLIQTSKLALAGDSLYQKSFWEIAERHQQMIEAVIPEGQARKSLLTLVNALLEELRSIYHGVFLIRDLSPKTSDTIVSYGERISSRIVAALVEGAEWFDAREFIKTEMKSGRRLLASDLSRDLVQKTFKRIPKVSLVPGFIATDAESGEITNLGRGGSDYTASIIAAALDADT
ncbi:MAG: bifunctional aspartate kinase/homoserine dehydrogenase I, partial [Paraprevotella sp.]|nr:bifunctional aspartate kinase/homoserine dehydrogenase I [Paraprevotella sp.]